MRFNSLTSLPAIRNAELVELQVPYRLTLAEFQAMPVSTDRLSARKAIRGLEDTLAGFPDDVRIDQDTLTPIHRFSKGIYTRELTMPAGSIVVGKRHAQEHMVVMSEGFCTVFTERGQEDLVAPCSFTSPAGEKRVLIIHDKTTWTTIHRTDATDLDGVEADLILAEPKSDVLNIATNQGVSE